MKHFSDELVQKGFILVLDRRKDKWEAVKSCLQKLQVSNEIFPSLIVSRKLVIVEYNCEMIWLPDYLGKSSSDDDSDFSIFQQPE